MTPIEIENISKEFKYFFGGNLNFQNGIKMINTNPILREAINIGGTELFKASFATGKALPCAIIINNKIKRCLIGKILSHCKWISHWLIR